VTTTGPETKPLTDGYVANIQVGMANIQVGCCNGYLSIPNKPSINI